MSIGLRLRADEGHALQRLVREGQCREEVRRTLAMLRLTGGHSVSEVARLVEAARSSASRWLEALRRDGVGGLRQGRRGRGRSRSTAISSRHWCGCSSVALRSLATCVARAAAS